MIKRLMLLLPMALFALACCGQTVNAGVMNLSGPGGSGVGVVTDIGVSAHGAAGSMESNVRDFYLLPKLVATALEAPDAEDVCLVISAGKVSVSASGDFCCDVYDASGRLVAMQKSRADVSFRLQSGIYVVAVSRNGQVVCARKVIVKQ